MKKRAQVTLFIILGLLIVVILVLFMSIQRGLLKGKAEVEIGKKLTFADKVEQVKTQITSCIEEQTETAIILFGLHQNAINQYIKDVLPNCVDFSNFPDLDITKNSLVIDTTISQYGIDVLVNYPITIKKDGDIANLQKFQYTFDLLIDVDLELDSNSKTTKDKWLSSYDDKAVLFIPAGTKVTKNDVPVQKISMKMTNCITQVCFGRLSYFLQPTGTVFEPAAQYTIKYDESFLNLHPDQSEADLRIARYDPATNLWKAYECQVDTLNNKITAQVDVL